MKNKIFIASIIGISVTVGSVLGWKAHIFGSTKAFDKMFELEPELEPILHSALNKYNNMKGDQNGLKNSII